MQYRSTRDQAAKQMTAPEAILQGLAPDGGLFVPQSFPQPDYDLGALVNAPLSRGRHHHLGLVF